MTQEVAIRRGWQSRWPLLAAIRSGNFLTLSASGKHISLSPLWGGGQTKTSVICLLGTSLCQCYDILRWAHSVPTTPMTGRPLWLQSVGKEF